MAVQDTVVDVHVLPVFEGSPLVLEALFKDPSAPILCSPTDVVVERNEPRERNLIKKLDFVPAFYLPGVH